MNAQKLSERLAKVASYVPTGAVVADIGSDHAYLPCYLVHEGIAKRAVAGEVVKGPYESAVKQVRQEGLTDKVTVRLADGLAAVQPTDGVDTVTIAGMGGPLIADILTKNPESLTRVTRLILQPNIHAKAVRQWAIKNGFALLEEAILEEDSKIYEVLVLQRGDMQLNEAELLFGPHLLQAKEAPFRKKWLRELAQWQKILQSTANVEQTPMIVAKRADIQQKIALAEEVLQ
ncbi:tRNA (adenine(22)-N(1))-methyltransferase [Metalysinibacillus jejuensis]|uniref:tRNA (adenine(22)-N(1))-methyltransferase n=1 Tax=Metalysinibacillus jejuensis TaxID=914327 RepID=UPI000D3CE957|nr:tRNA (adenine(22)-N(1))-methyltransferase TrmK [Metalysinibacillus jejuensis]